MAIVAQVNLHGIALDPVRAGAILDDAVAASVDAVGQQAYSEVMTRLNQSIRHPTPYYETQVTRDEPGRFLDVVHDRGIVYGPWLEGTSDRNRTTRFKGYASFRRATQATRARTSELAERAVAPYVMELQ